MNESENLLELIQAQLDQFCDQQRKDFEVISTDLVPLVDYSKALLSGGKRFRALFTYWSWVGALAVSEPRQSQEQLAASSRKLASVTLDYNLTMYHRGIVSALTDLKSLSSKQPVSLLTSNEYS